MNIDGLIYTINQQGIALVSCEQRVTALQNENEALRAAFAEARAQLDAENNPPPTP